MFLKAKLKFGRHVDYMQRKEGLKASQAIREPNNLHISTTACYVLGCSFLASSVQKHLRHFGYTIRREVWINPPDLKPAMSFTSIPAGGWFSVGARTQALFLFVIYLGSKGSFAFCLSGVSVPVCSHVDGQDGHSVRSALPLIIKNAP